ncbi:nickel-binding protein [Flagellimonas sp. 2504JD4-2]
MDRHIVPGIEAKHAAQAHREDLKIQDEYGCRCMTYWVDEERGSAFCLIDAPNKQAVKEMHDRAHGLIPHDIVQVNSNVVEAFLGRISDPETYPDIDDPNLKIFNDPAFRIILVAKCKDFRLLGHELGKNKSQKLMGLYHEIMRQELQKYEGREVELEGDWFIASFVSVTQAVDCAIAVQKSLHIATELLELRMGLNAGMPVSKSKHLFGETVDMAKYLCHLHGSHPIKLASIIKEIYKEDGSSNYRDRMKAIKPTHENTLQLLMETLFENLQKPDWGVDDFCAKLSMSKSKLYRKSKELTGMSPNELLREHRLLRSLELLRTDRNVSQTTFDVGFSSPSYFTKCFQQRFGLQPLAYAKNTL